MHPHFTLHRAVVLTLGFIAASTQQSVLALGLGDIEIKSFLNEPLKADIQVLGASDITDASCFKLASSNADSDSVGHLSVKLGASNNDTAILSLTGSKAVNEPIVNLKVTADCGANVGREYVLLIDPPLSYHATKPAINGDAITTKADTVDEKSANITSINPKISDKTTLILPTAPYKKVLARPVAHKRSAQPSQLSQAVVIKASTLPSVAAMPKLTLSGGGEITAMNMPFKLRLDKQLSLSAETQPLAQTNDLQDEVTAMRNRMAHLQAQITHLEQTNQALLSKNSVAQNSAAQSRLSAPKAWLAHQTESLGTWLSAALLGLISYCGFIWLRGRQRRMQQAHSEVLFVAAENQSSLYDHDEFNALHEDDIFADVAPMPKVPHSAENLNNIENNFEAMDSVNQPMVLEDDNENLSILDHADVFLSHGRASLAIQLLQNHLIEFPKQSVTIWLFLLDLLTKENLKTIYETTATDCKKYFNVNIPEFATQAQSDNDQLESFPRLLEGLQAVWNTPLAVQYLNDLIYNTRAEPRIGLDKNLLEELILLKTVAQETQNTAEVIHFADEKIARIEQKQALKKQAQSVAVESLADALPEDASSTLQDTFAFDLVDYK